MAKYLISDNIFVTVTTQWFVGTQKEAARTTSQRKWILPMLRNAIEGEGLQLSSKSNDIAFSKHGSKFERAQTHGHDLDIYVTLHGGGLVWGTTPLYGAHGGSPNADALRTGVFIQGVQYRLPLSASDARDLMVALARKAFPANVDSGKISSSKRGGAVTGVGRRDYDLIPAFMVLRDDEITHIIPSGDGSWEFNATTTMLNHLNDMQRKFPRNSDQKILSFKDMIRALKIMSKRQSWKSKFGTTSYMIKWATIHTFQEEGRSRYNQDQMSKVVERLRSWVLKRIFMDPANGQQQALWGCEGELEASM